MSLAFENGAQAGARKDAGTIQKMLDENAVLIQTIVRYQRAGRVKDALRYQQLLHRNLVYLASLSDEATLKEELDTANPVAAVITANAPSGTVPSAGATVAANASPIVATTTPLIKK